MLPYIVSERGTTSNHNYRLLWKNWDKLFQRGELHQTTTYANVTMMKELLFQRGELHQTTTRRTHLHDDQALFQRGELHQTTTTDFCGRIGINCFREGNYIKPQPVR